MEKSMSAFITFVMILVWGFSETGAVDTEDFAINSQPRSLKDDVRQVFIPPANTNDSIQYRLYTRSNPNEPCFMEPTPEEFDHCAFDPSLETKVLIHGFLSTLKTEPSFPRIIDALLKQDYYNVIYVDWSHYNEHPYPLAVKNTVPVGKKIAEFIKFVKEHTGASCIHIIGHSLGAHVSGIAGKHVSNVSRITGLDPAGPLYEDDDRDVQLYYTDAEFVDVIHTSDELTGQGLGKYEPLGHMDFYPNGGRFQPGCHQKAKENIASGDVVKLIETPSDVANCNHVRSLLLFLHSISDCDYLSTKCRNYNRLSKCSSRGNPTARMGLFDKQIKGLPVKSRFFLNTTGSEPYC